MWSTLCPGRFNVGEETPSNAMHRGCVGLEASLEGCGKSHPTRIRTPDLPARGESLYPLRYLDCHKGATVTHNRLSIREEIRLKL